MAPCGLYCGTCSVYIATRDGNEKFRALISSVWGTKPEETKCLGCMQSDPSKIIFDFCKQCEIRSCITSKGLYSCHQCKNWPCTLIENFIFAVGARVMKRAIPLWRDKVAELGDEKGSLAWARAECERYHCSACGEPLFRGAQHCRACKKPVADELDGAL